MIHENRESITINPFVSFDGDVEMCQVIFKGKGITSHMEHPDINNLFLSTTENGVQDRKSLQAAYKTFDNIIVQKGVQKTVLVVTDGHSSRFCPESMTYLFSNDLGLFLGPPDKTSVTQLLDQINQSLHAPYRTSKKNIFTNEMTVDKEGFMSISILAEIWPTWATSDTIQKAAKLVGVSKGGLNVGGLNVDGMNQEKFCRNVEFHVSELDQIWGKSITKSFFERTV